MELLLELPAGTRFHPVVHVSRVLPYRTSTTPLSRPPAVDRRGGHPRYPVCKGKSPTLTHKSKYSGFGNLEESLLGSKRVTH